MCKKSNDILKAFCVDQVVAGPLSSPYNNNLMALGLDEGLAVEPSI